MRLLSCLLALILLTATVEAQTVTEFAIPAPGENPSYIVSGPDNHLWFTLTEHLGRIPAGAVSAGKIEIFETKVGTEPEDQRFPRGIAFDEGSNSIWFTSVDEFGISGYIGSLPVNATETTEPTYTYLRDISIECLNLASPGRIISGGDGYLYFTAGGEIARISVDRLECDVFKPKTSGDTVSALVLGSDGNIYFSLSGAKKIGRIEKNSEEILEYPFAGTTVSAPIDLIVGTDGDIWYTTLRHIGHLNDDKTIEEFQVPGIAAGGGVNHITAGPPGTPMWFTVSNATDELVGRITPAGTFKGLTSVTTEASNPFGIVVGPDNNLWVTEVAGDALAKIEPDDILDISSASPLPSGARGQAYSTTLTGSEGTAPYTFSVPTGSVLPPGLSLAADGTISGTPTENTLLPLQFVVKITDAEGLSNQKTFEISITLPDLADLSVDLKKVKFKKGKLSGSAVPINIGVQAASASTVNFYVSQNQALDAKDRLISSKTLGAVAAGQKAAGISLKYAKSIAKKFKFLLACIDPANAISEQSDDNNCDFQRIPGR